MDDLIQLNGNFIISQTNSGGINFLKMISIHKLQINTIQLYF